MPTITNNVQTIVERSIFEAIRLIVVKYSYAPDISDTITYPSTPAGQIAFNTAQKSIKDNMGFSIGVYGHSSSQDKGKRNTPRIVIIPRRIMPGSIGNPIGPSFKYNPTDPAAILKYNKPFDSSDLDLDIHLVSSDEIQDRIIHSILNEAIGARNFVKVLGSQNPNEKFFIKQISYNDIPDTIDGEEEKVYSYEIPDLYLFDGIVICPISPITQIHIDFQINADQDSMTIS